MLNRTAFNFSIEFNQLAPITPKTTVNTSGTSFLEALRNVAQSKESLTVTRVTQQLRTATLSLKRDINLNVPHLLQYSNECGPTSLAMILKYYGKDVSKYHSWFSSDAIGHSPRELANYAKNQGMNVRQKENASLEDLAKLVDQGLPALVLGIYGGGNTTTIENYVNNFADNAKRAHWMVVTGYKRDDLGKITHVYFNNPNSSSDQCWTASDFLNKFWNNNLVPDGHRYLMTMAPQGSYQSSSLNKLIPTNQLDKWYDLANDTYASVYASIKAGRSVDKAIKAAFDKLEDVYDEIADLFDDAGDALADAWDEVSGWFS